MDEAHQLEDVATQYFGVAFSNYRVDDLVRDGQRLLATVVVRAAEGRDAGARADARRRCTRTGFSPACHSARGCRIPAEARARYTADALGEHFGRRPDADGALEGLEATLALMQQPAIRDPGPDGSRSGPSRSDPRSSRATHAATRRRAAHRPALPHARRRSRLRLSTWSTGAGAVSSARVADRRLADRPRRAVRPLSHASSSRRPRSPWTARSPTSKGGSVSARADEIRVPSEFDFARQALLYLPRRMPPPKSPSFAEAVARETIALLTHSRGRAFVLFTSYKVLRAVSRSSRWPLPYPMLVQGTAPRSALIERVPLDAGNAVLLATSSFWQGVDVVGDALSCVVIDKLPFASPGDPVTAARIDAITARGGDAFAEYQVPLAILALQQGLGRLIRHRGDRGVLAVLDPRLRTMGYGRRFLASLPPAPVTHDLACGRASSSSRLFTHTDIRRAEASAFAEYLRRLSMRTHLFRGVLALAVLCAVSRRRRWPRAWCAARSSTRRASPFRTPPSSSRRGRQSQDADEDRQERRVPAGRAVVGRLQGHGVEGQASDRRR